ncbi:MAG: glycohydrolase toxin TNT-related protein, partial [Phocaeicola sp.]|nr:glycohydrolase toxin TNT-related protein [Phocaeicola sp.]
QVLRPDNRQTIYERDTFGRIVYKNKEYYYRYDGEGNLILKSTRNVLDPPVMPQPKDWLDKLFTRTTPNDKDLQAHYGWQQGDTAYEWYGNGMLKSVRTPEGATIRFEYDALGRRTLKETHDTCHRYAWDGNVLLHEWSYDRREKPRTQQDELGRIRYDRQEPYNNLVTWVYDGNSYTPVAKLTEEDSYSIVQDYLGTPIQALDSKGEVVWDCILDIYGDVLELRGERDFIPFRFQGQYEDGETGLYYNRFRYYDSNTGNYISQDPIGLAGSNPTLYGYVFDSNAQIDPFGLDCGKSKIWQDKNGRWRNPNGTFAKHPGWPDNFGFTQGTDIIGMLGAGHRIDRYGGTNGRFVANAGTPFTQRSLPATDISKEFHTYEVIKPIDGVRTGTAEPWFGQQGGGIQHQLPNSVQYYLDNGNLKEI